ncbi:hypothetical protein O181_049826 [Austropuccinia psidii MF-1]|uniref:Uncharacterized protein n=1 Tax=Austropuccinia psidii MF-1 TaxID=1389203 RepID=A0A9Q3E0N9_9BASI|nr:hypothetical protein [Austropuccinia psidii MF-1]
MIQPFNSSCFSHGHQEYEKELGTQEEWSFDCSSQTLCANGMHPPDVTTTRNDPPPWVLRKFSLEPSWGQLATPYLLWPIDLLWPEHLPLAFHGLRPYPAIIGLPGQFPYLQPSGHYLWFWAWGVLLSPSPHHHFWANPFH